MSIATELANAVAFELGQNKYDVAYQARPEYEPSELEGMKIVVVPKSIAVDRTSRASVKYTVSVDIGVMQRIGPDMTPDDAVDVYGKIVDDITELLVDSELSMFPVATFVGIANDPLYAMDYLVSSRIFMSVLTATYSVLSY